MKGWHNVTVLIVCHQFNSNSAALGLYLENTFSVLWLKHCLLIFLKEASLGKIMNMSQCHIIIVYTRLLFDCCESGSGSCSVMSTSLQSHGLQPSRLFCPWNSSERNTGVISHSLQGSFLTFPTSLLFHMLAMELIPSLQLPGLSHELNMDHTESHVLCCAQSFSCVPLFATKWTVAHPPLSMGVLQARIQEWIAMSSSRGSSQPRD